jgi:hypothetical protein
MWEEDSWFGVLIAGNEGLGTLFLFGLSGSSSQFQKPTMGQIPEHAPLCAIPCENNWASFFVKKEGK